MARMYGKSFESMFEGSMVGAGLNVFAVWGYIITKAKRGFIEINPKLLAFTLGGSESEVQAALNFLQEPDVNSRSKLEEGRRLVKEGQFQYRIVNWQIYDEIKNEIERRDYNRVRQQQFRERQQASTGVNNGQPSPPVRPTKPPADNSQALAIYDAYPRKISRPDALRAITKALTKTDFEKLLNLTQEYAKARTGEPDQYTPHPATWFNAERYNDDPATWKSNAQVSKPNPRNLGIATAGPSYGDAARAKLERQRMEREMAEAENAGSTSAGIPAS